MSDYNPEGSSQLGDEFPDKGQGWSEATRPASRPDRLPTIVAQFFSIGAITIGAMALTLALVCQHQINALKRDVARVERLLPAGMRDNAYETNHATMHGTESAGYRGYDTSGRIKP